MNYKKLASLLLAGWCLTVLASLGWNTKHTQQEHLHFLQDTARLIFDHVILVREWNANHGGVYVPITESSPPNQYLEIENREIVVDDKLTLTMINPAYMTRQIAELATQSNGIQLHITSLNPIRPSNKPSTQERVALLEFEAGDSEEFSRLLADKNGYRFFYMAPLLTTQACLRCHEKQGYVEGDLRGGISVTIPDIHPAPIQGIIIGHCVIGVIGILVILTLAQKLSESYEKVRQQSIIDVLTGIPNRRHFIDRLATEYRRASRNSTPLTLLITDIDHFKQYNDSLGHLEGDQCIVIVAKTVKASLQRGGDLCARYGGEEFIVILPNTDTAGGEKVARRIQKNIAALEIEHPDTPIGEHITLSIGLATDYRDYPSQYNLIKRADEALYRCKQLGRNCIESNGHDNTDNSKS
ncbi:diguanylate cyclase [Candidatus Thiodiazotropha sp. CDECU1]|uniref:diguanylate cyclase n=1 Tax=Candidatus Thiodiazotropha sp. CDECU1 TaxID=3065865 RepID=UPI0029307BEC|nr:diguanylate cyclase [Candidatus Thiodiazotropha sp. CDECU1]